MTSYEDVQALRSFVMEKLNTATTAAEAVGVARNMGSHTEVSMSTTNYEGAKAALEKALEFYLRRLQVNAESVASECENHDEAWAALTEQATRGDKNATE